MVSLVTNGNLTYKNSPITDKLNQTIIIQTDIISTLKAHGCPSCLELVRQIVKKYVDSPLPTATKLKPTSHGDGL
jgi:hypothetical protein